MPEKEEEREREKKKEEIKQRNLGERKGKEGLRKRTGSRKDQQNDRGERREVLPEPCPIFMACSAGTHQMTPGKR